MLPGNAVWMTDRIFGFVDPHAERDGRDDHFELAVEESVLHAPPPFGIEARVIRRGGKVLREQRRHALGLLAAGRIDDRRTMLGIGQQLARQVGPLRRAGLHHFDRDIRAAKAVDEARRMIETQLFADIVLHHGVAVAVSAITGAGRSVGR